VAMRDFSAYFGYPYLLSIGADVGISPLKCSDTIICLISETTESHSRSCDLRGSKCYAPPVTFRHFYLGN